MDSCVFIQGTEDVPGYHLVLAEEEWVTVRWDWVEKEKMMSKGSLTATP